MAPGRGDADLFAAIIAIGLLAAIAFVTDAGQKLAAAAQAQAVAGEAARAGATEVNASAAYAGHGPLAVDPAQAAAAARAYLAPRQHRHGHGQRGHRRYRHGHRHHAVDAGRADRPAPAVRNRVGDRAARPGRRGTPAVTAHRAARLIRAAASAILLAALIAGLPAALSIRRQPPPASPAVLAPDHRRPGPPR